MVKSGSTDIHYFEIVLIKEIVRLSSKAQIVHSHQYPEPHPHTPSSMVFHVQDSDVRADCSSSHDDAYPG